MPTCDVKTFDKTVVLPAVNRADILTQGAGRYTGATKAFNFALNCEHNPKVNVTFNGTKMPGVVAEDVLKNTLTGNDNVGIQLVRNNTALKIGTKTEMIAAAGASEDLAFNAYYYYKGGDIQSGPVKAQSEFTFSYE